MMIGYARVSTEGQTLDQQRAALKAAGCKRVFEEKASGTQRGRPELVKMLDHLQPGNVVTVMRLDRLARSTRDLLDIAERIGQAEAGLRSLAEPGPCSTPIRSPQSNGMAAAFVKTFKRDYVSVNPRPDAATVIAQLPSWFEHYNTLHPHKALGYRSPRESLNHQTET